jgi:hypothetical protein
MYALKSGMFESSGRLKRGHEFTPTATLFGQDLTPHARQFVITAPALSGFFDPLSRNESFAFQPVKDGIKRSYLKGNCATRLPLDLYSDFIAMARPVFELRQYKELCTAFLPGMIVGIYRCHIVHSYISRTTLPRQHSQRESS